jgi:AraC-like DNA-binding protein
VHTFIDPLEYKVIRVDVRPETGRICHDAILARFLEFLTAHPNRPLYLTEICPAIGVSERTLRVVCEERLGMSPIRYLTLRRMHRVRIALLRAEASNTTVTRIALDLASTRFR